MASRGLPYTIGIVVNRVVPEWLFRFRVTSIYRLGTGATETNAANVVEGLTKEDFALAAQLTGYHRDARDGSLRVFLASAGGQSVGAIWCAEGVFEEPELGLRYELTPSDRWWFAARVIPESRGRGVYTALLSQALTNSLSNNHLVAINPTNLRSLAAHRRFTEACLGTFATVRVLRWAWCVGGGRLFQGRRWTTDHRRRPLIIRLCQATP